MFKKLILGLARKIVMGEQKKAQTAKMTAADKVRQEAYQRLQELYSFVNFLHTKVFRNRHERKTFWRNVQNGQPQVEETIQNIMNVYMKEKGVVKPSSVSATVKKDACTGECKNGSCDCEKKSV